MGCCGVSAGQASPSFFERNEESLKTAFLVMGVALAIIGVLAANDVGELSALAPHWYYFEVGAVVCFIARCVDCSKQVTEPLSSGDSKPIGHASPASRKPTAEELYLRAEALEGRQEFDRAYVLYLDTANDHQHLPSLFKAAQFQEIGKGCDSNPIDAKNRYKTGADRGYLPAIYKMALLECEANQREEAVAWIRKAKENGCDQAEGFLNTLNAGSLSLQAIISRVRLLLTYHGVKPAAPLVKGPAPQELYRQAQAFENDKKFEKAYPLYLRAAESHLPSRVKVAEFHAEGWGGIAKSAENAKSHYKIAADAGYIEAIYKMADYACKAQEWDEATLWIEKAQALNCARAKGLLDKLREALPEPPAGARPSTALLDLKRHLFSSAVVRTLSYYKATNALRS